MNFDSAILYVKDIEKTKTFYTEKLGFIFDHQENNIYLSLKVNRNDHVFVAFYAKKDYEKLRGKQTFMIRTDNIKDEYDVIRKSVNIFKPLKTYSWGQSFSVKDIDGNKIEIIQI